MKLLINLEYAKLVPPLNKQEYENLKKNISENGQQYPIAYNKKGEILDGHTRFKICQELGIERKIENKPRYFDSETDEKIFVINSNLQRRHLSTPVRAKLALRLKPLYEQKAKVGRPKKGEEITQTFGEFNRHDREALSQAGKDASVSRESIRKMEILEKEGTDQQQQLVLDEPKKFEEVVRSITKTKKRKKLEEEGYNSVIPEGATLLNEDFMKSNIQDNSIDLIFTDPPYGTKTIPLYKDLGKFAMKKLKDGGSLVTYIGQYTLPEIVHSLEDAGLKYWWIICVKHAGAHSQMNQRFVYVDWKPLLWYVKGEKSNIIDTMSDYIQSESPKKDSHDWEQSIVEAEYIIKHLSQKNETVLDPFMGSGTTGKAALKLERKFIGVEIDKERFQVARAELGK